MIAACQENEKAIEFLDGKDGWHGLLTLCLIPALKSLIHGYATTASTYDDLERHLEAAFKCRVQTKQQAKLSGMGTRILFESGILDINAPVIAGVTNVTQHGNQWVLTLDKGSSSGVNTNDVYSIRDPQQGRQRVPGQVAEIDAQIVVSRALPFESEATITRLPAGPPPGPPGTRNVIPINHWAPRSGWMATLVERASCVEARVHYDPLTRWIDEVKDLHNSWRSECDPRTKIALSFSATPSHAPTDDNLASFNIQFTRNSDTVRFFDNQGRGFSGIAQRVHRHMSPLDTKASNLTQRIMRRLQHLHSFSMVSELRPSPYLSRPIFDAKLEYYPESQAMGPNTVHCRLSFQNKHSSVLFITVLNLTPQFGVKQWCPPKAEGKGIPVEKGTSWSKHFGIRVPAGLSEASRTRNFRMTDVVKIFVSTQLVDFRHFEVDDLPIAENQNWKDMVDTPVDGAGGVWCVDEHKITIDGGARVCDIGKL